LSLPKRLYARTSAKKTLNGGCFWGENFEFRDLPKADRVSLLIHKDKGGANAAASAAASAAAMAKRTKKNKKPVGRIRVSVASIQSRYTQEKWHPVEKSSRRENPSVRLRCQFQSVDVLPIRDYEEMLYFLKDEYKAVCRMLEPQLPVR
jgi:RAS protein activator-like 2